ncbi:MAG: site-specific integrase [Firmicutes bacterium]|nr:site-specific integrase [Bacillota bacterium]
MKITPRGPKTYRLTWELGRDPVTGKRRQRTETYHGDRKSAEARWREVQREIDQGLTVDPRRRTVSDLFDYCLEAVWPQALAPTSLLDYQRKVKTYLRPAFGAIRLRQLTPDVIQRGYAALARQGARGNRPLSPKTLAVIHAVFRAALSEAERIGWIPRNPARLVRVPTPPEREPQLWTAAQWQAVWRQVEATPWGLAVWLAATTGLRKGEILGLRWQDIDWEAGTLRVAQAQHYLPGGEIAFGPPKTPRSRRTLALGPETVAVLKAHRKRQAERKLALGDAYDDCGLVVQGPAGGPVRPRTLIAWFHRACAAAGAPRIHFHDLRHLHATVLLAAGVPVRVVSERLGHARIQTTLQIYGHVLPTQDQDAAALLEQLLGTKSGTNGSRQDRSPARRKPS